MAHFYHSVEVLVIENYSICIKNWNRENKFQNISAKTRTSLTNCRTDVEFCREIFINYYIQQYAFSTERVKQFLSNQNQHFKDMHMQIHIWKHI